MTVTKIMDGDCNQSKIMKTLDDKQISNNFFNEYIKSKGPKGWVSRYISNTGRWYTDMLIKEGQITADDKILDVGCGSATTIVNLLKKVSLKYLIQGIEPSDSQIELARKNLAKASLADKAVLKQGFASPLPFDDKSFDVVYASFIFKHFADETLADFFQEAHRVLKTGGRLLSWEFAQVNSPVLNGTAKRDSWHLRDFSQIDSMLKNAGFQNSTEFDVSNRGFWDKVKNVGFKVQK